MKKFLMLTAAGLIFQATPVLAGHHEGGEDHKGGMFAKHDTNGDGVISEAEFLAHAKAKFAQKDTNGDGSISREEAKAAKQSKREKMKDKREKIKEKHQERHSDQDAE